MPKNDDISGPDAVTQFYNQVLNTPGMKAAREAMNRSALRAAQELASSAQVEFSVFCIENIAQKLEISGEEAYRLLTGDNDILDEYIIPNYEILHTQSKAYIVNDIIDYMKECGVLK